MEKTMYDCVAYMIRTLLDSGNDQLVENFRAISDKQSKLFNKILYKEFPELIDENGNAKEILTPYSINVELVNQLYKLADDCAANNRQMLLAQMVNKIDIGLAKAAANAKTDTRNTEGLNFNYNETGIQILPRCFSSWAHDNKDRNCSNSLNNLLNHLLFIDIWELERRIKCTVSHCILSSDRFFRAADNGYLKIGITPFGDESVLAVQKKETEVGVCEFQVTGVSNEEELVKNVVDVIEKAKSLGVDILCFPEMLGTELLLGKIRETLSVLPGRT